MINRLPRPCASKIALVALIGLDGGAQFDMHPDGWISDRPMTPEIPVAPEVCRAQGTRALCIYGEVERRACAAGCRPGSPASSRSRAATASRGRPASWPSGSSRGGRGER